MQEVTLLLSNARGWRFVFEAEAMAAASRLLDGLLRARSGDQIRLAVDNLAVYRFCNGKTVLAGRKALVQHILPMLKLAAEKNVAVECLKASAHGGSGRLRGIWGDELCQSPVDLDLSDGKEPANFRHRLDMAAYRDAFADRQEQHARVA
jgi:hypothetical protein